MRRRKKNDGPMKDLQYKELECSCGRIVEVDSEIESVMCWECVQKLCPVDPAKLMQRKVKNPNDVKPRGWRFMKEFVDQDGTVYHAGEEMPDLKGTLPPTDIIAIKKAQKEKSKERKSHKAEREAKKEAKLLKEFEKKKKIKEHEERKKEKELAKLQESGE